MKIVHANCMREKTRSVSLYSKGRVKEVVFPILLIQWRILSQRAHKFISFWLPLSDCEVKGMAPISMHWRRNIFGAILL